MESIVAAALIAVGIVLAAVVYGRMHGARTAPAGSPTAAAPVVEVVPPDPVRRDADMLERTAAVTRREEAMARKESELEKERSELAQARRRCGAPGARGQFGPTRSG